jgi:hypothetical protein
MKRESIIQQKSIIIVGELLLILIISGCAALGTKTILRSSNLNAYNFKKLGYSQPASEEIVNKIRQNTSNIYQSSVESFFADKAIKVEKHNLSDFKLIDKIDTTEITKICHENGLDGYLCTQIKYKFVDNYYMLIPLGKSEDAYVEIKLFDSNGTLMLHTKHNTFAAPKAEQTVRDGTFGALKQIIKEIKK